MNQGRRKKVMFLLDPTSVGQGNKAFFIRVWKPLLSRRILKTLKESLKRIISASGGLHHCVFHYINFGDGYVGFEK